MPKIILRDKVVEDNWQLIAKDFDGELPDGKLLLPMQYWLDNREALSARTNPVGIWIDSDEEVELIGEEADQFPIIGVNFLAFTDGRGFSTGRLLRERYQFKGQLRAIGGVIRDQLFFLKRCGFDAYQLREGYNLEESLDSLNDFSKNYQTSVDQLEPLFRNR